MHDLLAMRKSFTQDGVLMSFNGPFSHSIIEEIGNAIKHYLEGENINKGAVTDVFGVYIEQTQNVRNYLARRAFAGSERNSAIVVIAIVDGLHVVSSGNVVLKSDAADLAARLDEINALDKDGLKRFYKEKLRAERAPDAFGAGIGLIDMARRAKGKIEYSFVSLDAGHDFFSLSVKVAGA